MLFAGDAQWDEENQSCAAAPLDRVANYRGENDLQSDVISTVRQEEQFALLPGFVNVSECLANSSLSHCAVCLSGPTPSPAGKAYPPEFYYDTYNPLWQNRPRVFDFKLQWTQMNPNAVDRIVAYRLGFRQVGDAARRCFPLGLPSAGRKQHV